MKNTANSNEGKWENIAAKSIEDTFIDRLQDPEFSYNLMNLFAINAPPEKIQDFLNENGVKLDDDTAKSLIENQQLENIQVWSGYYKIGDNSYLYVSPQEPMIVYQDKVYQVVKSAKDNDGKFLVAAQDQSNQVLAFSEDDTGLTVKISQQSTPAPATLAQNVIKLDTELADQNGDASVGTQSAAVNPLLDQLIKWHGVYMFTSDALKNSLMRITPTGGIVTVNDETFSLQPELDDNGNFVLNSTSSGNTLKVKFSDKIDNLGHTLPNTFEGTWSDKSTTDTEVKGEQKITTEIDLSPVIGDLIKWKGTYELTEKPNNSDKYLRVNPITGSITLGHDKNAKEGDHKFNLNPDRAGDDDVSNFHLKETDQAPRDMDITFTSELKDDGKQEVYKVSGTVGGKSINGEFDPPKQLNTQKSWIVGTSIASWVAVGLSVFTIFITLRTAWKEVKQIKDFDKKRTREFTQYQKDAYHDVARSILAKEKIDITGLSDQLQTVVDAEFSPTGDKSPADDSEIVAGKTACKDAVREKIRQEISAKVKATLFSKPPFDDLLQDKDNFDLVKDIVNQAVEQHADRYYDAYERPPVVSTSGGSSSSSRTSKSLFDLQVQNKLISARTVYLQNQDFSKYMPSGQYNPEQNAQALEQVDADIKAKQHEIEQIEQHPDPNKPHAIRNAQKELEKLEQEQKDREELHEKEEGIGEEERKNEEDRKERENEFEGKGKHVVDPHPFHRPGM